jgi:hypothetical protein
MSGYPRLKGLAALVSVLLSACAAGGSTGSRSAPSTAQPSRADAVAVSFSVHVSTSSAKSQARHTSTIPAATQSIRIAVLDSASNPVAGSPFTLDTSSGSPACVGSGASRTCSTTLNVPVGNDTFTASAFDGSNGTGTLLVSATVTQQIYLNATNLVGLALPSVAPVLADTITPGTYAGASGNAITMLSHPSALASLAISGGTGAYTVVPLCLASVATVSSVSPGSYQIKSFGAGSCSITIRDSVSSLPSVSLNVVAYPTPSTTLLNFCLAGAGYLQTVTITGGVPPFTIVSPLPIVTTSISGYVLSVYANTAASAIGTIAVYDSLSGLFYVTAYTNSCG